MKNYEANEAKANAKYLIKAIEVTGPVSPVDKNQEGKVTVILSSEDPDDRGILYVERWF